jgi:hypothetical protein
MGYILLSFIMIMITGKYFILNYKINFLLGLGFTGFSFFVLPKNEKKIIIDYLYKITGR